MKLKDETVEKLKILAVKIHAIAMSKGWWYGDHCDTCDEDRCDKNQTRTLAHCIALAHTELMEAGLSMSGNDDKLTDLPGEQVEIADAIIRMLDAGQFFEIAITGEWSGGLDRDENPNPDSFFRGYLHDLLAKVTDDARTNSHPVQSYNDFLYAAITGWFTCEEDALIIIDRKTEYNATRPHKHGKKF
jgi:hypothetical protein